VANFVVNGLHRFRDLVQAVIGIPEDLEQGLFLLAI
jgi:hypothetical protein